MHGGGAEDWGGVAWPPAGLEAPAAAENPAGAAASGLGHSSLVHGGGAEDGKLRFAARLQRKALHLVLAVGVWPQRRSEFKTRRT